MEFCKKRKSSDSKDIEIGCFESSDDQSCDNVDPLTINEPMSKCITLEGIIFFDFW